MTWHPGDEVILRSGLIATIVGASAEQVVVVIPARGVQGMARQAPTRRCGCGCGQPVYGRAIAAGAACRQRISRSHRRV